MTLALHLGRAVLVRVLGALLALGGLAVALDLVESAAEVLAREDGGLLRYLALRAPVILTAVTPVALIVGPVLAFLTLAGRSEFVVLRAAGATTYRMLLSLTPVALALGLGFFMLTDRVSPTLEGRLSSWLDPAPAESAGAFWARTPQGVIRAAASSTEGERLSGVDIYAADLQGRLIARINAGAAIYENGGWRLEDATRLVPGEARSVRIDGERWETTLRPANVRALAAPTRSVAGNVAERILSGGWVGNRTADFYRTRVYRGYAAFIAPFVMILLAAPAAFGTRRGGGLGGRAALAVALGFCFLLLDGMLTALGETGNLPPALAAFGASAIFGALGLWLLISLEE